MSALLQSLREVADSNMSYMVSTAVTFHDEMSLSKEMAP